MTTTAIIKWLNQVQATAGEHADALDPSRQGTTIGMSGEATRHLDAVMHATNRALAWFRAAEKRGL